MFKIVLKNVGKDMVNKDFTTKSNNMNEAVVVAFAAVRDILGLDKTFIFAVVEREIHIKAHGVTVGSLTITKVH